MKGGRRAARGDSKASRRLSFFGGKGGVGKTTLATAFALSLSQRGQRTLLVSTDPAHSTSDILGIALSGEPSRIEENLWGVEIDPAADAAAYIDRIKEDARDVVSAEVLATVRKQLEMAKATPGTEESALIERFADLIALCPEQYDRVVFDTAPTGHTLRLLALPALLTAWIEGVIRQREKAAGMQRWLRNLAGQDKPRDDPLLKRLRIRQQSFHHARHRLLEDAFFYLLLTPERLAIEETARTLNVLKNYGIEVAALIVNRVLPAPAEGAYMRARLEQQDGYLEEIEERLEEHRIVRIEQDAFDIMSRDQLTQIACQLDRAGLR